MSDFSDIRKLVDYLKTDSSRFVMIRNVFGVQEKLSMRGGEAFIDRFTCPPAAVKMRFQDWLQAMREVKEGQPEKWREIILG